MTTQIPTIRMLALQYPYEKPKPPIQLWLLSTLVIVGLVALFLAAFHAFSQVAIWPQALAAAFLIEVGLVIESIALIKRPKSIFPWIALVIAYIVSGTYNYTQAQAAETNLNWWQLSTLALGPLSALAFVSLTLGYELREHQRKIEEWNRKRAEWAEIERKRLEERAEKERKRQERRAERDRKRAEERAERDRKAEILPEFSGNFPQWLPEAPANLKHFKMMVKSGQIILPPGLTGEDLTAIPAVGTPRTGRNWLAAVGYRELSGNGNIMQSADQ